MGFVAFDIDLIYFKIALDWDGDRIEMCTDKSFQLAATVNKEKEKLVIAVEASNNCDESTSPKELKVHHSRFQKRVSGKFQREKVGVKIKRHPGLGRHCPQCESKQSNSTTLRRHLKFHCPVELISEGPVLEQLLADAKRSAHINRHRKVSESDTSALSSSHGSSFSNAASLPSFIQPNITVNVSSNGERQECSIPKSMASNMQTKFPVESYQVDFRKSLDNPLSGSSYRAASTKQKVCNAVRDIINLCGFKCMEEIYTENGLIQLQKAFDRPVKFGTLKASCAALIEFLEFIELYDELPSDSRKRMRLLEYLRKAKTAFSRGVKLDNAERRAKLTQAIHSGSFPTFREINEVYQWLDEKVRNSFNYFFFQFMFSFR